MVPRKRVEILYFASCPGWREAEARVREVLDEAGLEGSVDLKLVPIEGAEHARAERFLGSPTVRVDGRDIEEAARERDTFAMQCRVYEHEGRLEGAPPKVWIRAALDASLSVEPA